MHHHVMRRFLLITTAFLISGAAHAQDRLALVVGIDSYQHVEDLTKAANDARAVSDVLADVGFEVTTLIDADERAFNRELASFTSSIDPGDEVVFYFAGHGIEIEGLNYLLPSDAPDSPSERVIRSDSIDADEVLREVQRAGASIAVMILDACRDNPYASSGRSVGGSRGLNIISAPVGSFVLMSAASGAVAYEGDDDDPNSIFTRALLPLLQEPGLPLPDLARQLRRDVQRIAAELGHSQRPAYYDEVSGEFFFATALVEPDAPSAAEEDPCEAARQDWFQIGFSNQSLVVFEAFIDLHGSCLFYRSLAEARLQSLRFDAEANTTSVQSSEGLPLGAHASAGNPPAQLPDIDAELELPPLPPLPEEALPSLEETEAIYAADGIWPRTPDRPFFEPFTISDDIYVASIDPAVSAVDAVALPPAGVNPGELLRRLPPPPPFGAEIDRDARGLVTPTPEGVLSPEGAFVVLGRPPVVAEPRPREIAPPPEPVADLGAEDAILGTFEPRPRPGDLEETRERQILGGLTVTELAGLRPESRPVSAQEAAAQSSRYAPTKGNPSLEVSEDSPQASEFVELVLSGREVLGVEPREAEVCVIREFFFYMRDRNSISIPQDVLRASMGYLTAGEALHRALDLLVIRISDTERFVASVFNTQWRIIAYDEGISAPEIFTSIVADCVND